jgi:error-prone DNA polymerase
MPEAPNSKISHEWIDPPTRVADCEAAYAELCVTTNFSFLRGASHPDEMVFQAALLGHRAIAITDRNTLAGAVRAYEASKKCGIKLIVGARLELIDGPEALVWAMDRAGYANLCRLLTLGKRRAKKGECHLWINDLAAHSQGLLAAIVAGAPEKNDTASAPPIIADCGTMKMAADCFALLKDVFAERLSLAVSAVYGPDDQQALRESETLARRYGIPLLATNDVHYHDPGRRPLQDVLTCIRHGCTIANAGFRLFPNAERHIKSPHQMRALLAAYPSAFARAMEIAERCTFSMGELKYEYPSEFVPPGMTTTQYLAKLSWEGAAEHYPTGVPPKVSDQINHELDLIAKLKYEPYFLTIHDIVAYARSKNILCQGRGSAANSAVCYCLGITSVDPATSQLLFARFISAARNEPPDIDVDFEHERREEVIQYVYEKYGRHRAGMVAALITYRGRSAVRDVGKALGLGLDLVDQIARQLDWWHRGSLTDDQLRSAGLDPADRTVQLIIQRTTELLGFPRHLSQHSGGMVMSQSPLCDLVPIENATMENRTVIEWDKDDIDVLGLMKVDILALGMLTCISKAFALIREPFALHSIPSDDPAVYEMIQDADTVGVFQIESRAQMSMLPRLKPRCFYDLVIEVAIVRPGPIQGDMVHPYLRRRNGLEEIEYPSEELKVVLSRTLGVPLFQEQAMSIAMVAAGFSADEADQLRRAMAAWKKRGGLQKFRDKLIGGMLARNYTMEFSERCFKQIEGFGEYGFPESHAASFAWLVYVSSWIKRHYPAVFCAALLNSQPMGFYAPAQIVRDAKEHGVEIRGVDVNHSDWDCTLGKSAAVPDSTKKLSEESDSIAGTPRVPENSALVECRLFTNSRLCTGSKHTWGFAGPSVRLGFRCLRGMPQSEAMEISAARNRPFSSLEETWRRSGVSARTMRLSSINAR